ncbi:MAG: sugar transporter [Alphaproteobacteria bacterium]|nr:sugar transporter [Alphaproteobacteria bacterium]
MKQILEKLRGAVKERLEQRKEVAPVQQGRVLVATQRDVRAPLLNFGNYRWVLFITLLAAIYYGLIASDRYVTEAQLYVKSTKNSSSSLSQLSLLTGASDQAKDALLLKSYIHSGDMLRYLDEQIGVKKHFSSNNWDIIARLDSEPTDEDFLNYYRDKVKISIDPESAVMSITGEAFTPEYSQTLVRVILTEAERFINGVGQKIATEEISFVDGELARAKAKVDDARNRMLAFQNENGLLDPAASGLAMQSVVNELEKTLVNLQTEHKVLSSYLNSSAPRVVALQSRIDSVTAQLAEERAKIAAQDTQSINEINARFQELEQEYQFASQLFQATLEGFEQARVESYHKLKHLVVIQAPSLPDEALEPRKIYNLATLFVLLSLAYGIVTMIIATIREHRDV